VPVKINGRDMDKTKLAVIFPVYNGARTLEASLQCIADQDYRDFRAIIVENKSTDGSLEVAKAFCQKDSRFEILENEMHLGVIDNFIRSIKLGSESAEYFCLRACDDLSTTDYLSKLLSALQADETKLLAVGSTERIDLHARQLIKPEPDVFDFWKNVSKGRVPRSLFFPSEWFYGIYRSKGSADILLERWPALGGPWCAASYTVAEFVVRDLVVWIDGPVYIFYRGSASEELYAAKSLTHKLRQRWLYTTGCYKVIQKLPILPWNTRRKIFKMFWRDARRKTNYRVRKHLLRGITKIFRSV
jgi:glycosyltransferase involved in cell wall biosynthesis